MNCPHCNKPILLLELMTETQRRRWTKYYVEGKTQQQIAYEEGISQQNVKKSLDGGVKRVLKRLK